MGSYPMQEHDYDQGGPNPLVVHSTWLTVLVAGFLGTARRMGPQVCLSSDIVHFATALDLGTQIEARSTWRSVVRS